VYPLVVTLHSWLRWAVVIVGVIAVVKFLGGWLGGKKWQPQDTRLAALFPMLVDIQLLLGLLLYFVVSPITTGALRNFGAAMSNSVTRYFAVEHVFMMLVALVVAHLGSMLPKKQTDVLAKFRLAAILTLLALVIIFLAIPWPFLAAGAGRPWFRLG
jgi:hypothetical protein